MSSESESVPACADFPDYDFECWAGAGWLTDPGFPEHTCHGCRWANEACGLAMAHGMVLAENEEHVRASWTAFHRSCLECGRASHVCNDCFHAALATERKARSEAEAQIACRSELNARIRDLEAERDALKAENERLTADRDWWKTDRDALKAELVKAVAKGAWWKADRDTLRADIKRKEEAIREARDLATKEPRKNPTARLEAVAAILSAALSPSPEGREEDKDRPDYIPPGERVAGAVCLDCGDLRMPNGFYRMDEDGCCGGCGRDAKLLYADGDVHFPEEHDAPAKAESPARCAGTIEMMGSGLTRCHLPAGHESDRDHESEIGCWPTTPEPQEGK